ncbi:MHS family MFS transporter [Paraburkholderia sp. Ac-20342]|uniref:MFS transporter n=1 Tax=Paraburkholderia sp. Ac-20342 TaxID=2703889 RepID=UPI0019811B84|nr:MFS transporter [Paraburkholderia sp. Ac-20342]MBN3850567.1 MHS family MFS transporter [Paraburkholderia sp. Ac-20342]
MAGTSQPRQKLWIPLTASAVGTFVEWFDFILYGAASALIFNRLFFPSFDPVTGTMAAFSAYAVGFFFRPLGGVVFGHFGDKYGRKPVLIVTLCMMGLSTAAIGLLPTYQQIGIWAPVMLVVLRIVQGLGAGAEYGGAVLVAAEAVNRRHGFFASFPAAAVDLSLVCATGAIALFSLMPSEHYLTWGWRIPFVGSLLVLAFGLFVRRNLKETDDYRRGTDRQARKMPLRTLLREHKARLLVAMGVNLTPSLSYVFQIFALSYATKQLHMPQNTILIGVILSGICGAIATVGFGALSDLVGRRTVIFGGAIFVCLFVFPFFRMLDSGTPWIVWAAVVLAHLGERAVFGVQPAYYRELFPVEVRYSGISVAREVTGSLVAGPLPLVATALIASTSGQTWPLASLVIGLAGLTAISILCAGRLDRPAANTNPATANG